MESIGKYRNSCPVTDTSSTGDHPLSHKRKKLSPLDFQFTPWILNGFDRAKMLKVTNDQVALSNQIHQHMGVSENVVYPIVPNGFADHYPYEKWLFHWEY